MYAGTEPQIVAFIHRKAIVWSERIPGPDGDVDDLMQEGRCALLAALPGYDPSRGRPLHVYLGGVLDNCYGKILRDVLAQKRTPHIDEWDEDRGEWTSVPCPTIPVDPADIHTAAYDVDMEENLARSERVAEITDRLYARLSDIQCHILDCYLSPEPELYFTARNLSGQYMPNIRHIAMFLEVPVTTVEYGVKKIRAEAARIIARVAREG